MKLLLWLILAVLSLPLAVLVLILYPVVWLLSIPFRLIGISVESALGFVRAVLTLPQRLLAGGRAN